MTFNSQIIKARCTRCRQEFTTTPSFLESHKGPTEHRIYCPDCRERRQRGLY